MSLKFFFRGLVIGFSIAAPVGPIGVLCIRRSLANGRLAGFVTGLGAASADAVFGCVAGLGLTAISAFLLGQKFLFSLLGGLFLCYLELRTFVSPPMDKSIDTKNAGLLSAYLSTFFLTLTNPMTILSFTAVFAGLGLGEKPSLANALNLVTGVFGGSALWWLVLSGGVGLFRSHITSDCMALISRLSGVVILGFGLYALSNAVIR
ncbi:MAG TPA: LysE family transporter [Candidatus Limnocylindrales bacterium]|nr:LysE family transporter [Candidatus Limnocylindrales bacterium]